MLLSDRGLELIVASEGKLKALGDGRYAAYLCPAGVWTIYTGCTSGVVGGMIVTEEEGKAMFRKELSLHEAAVRRLVTVDLTQGQFDALVSFSYNVGTGALENSSLLKKLNKGDHAGACKEFAKWDKATVKGKKVALRGLTIRRANEAAMFATREELPAIAQKVEPPKEPVTATQAVVATTTVAGSTVGVVQAIPSLPKPPTAILDSAAAWKGFALQAMEFGAFAASSPKAIAVIVAAGAAMVFGPKLAPKLFGKDG
jgi:lysozyme